MAPTSSPGSEGVAFTKLPGQNFTPDEDARIIELRGTGMEWQEIAMHIPGRNAMACYRRFNNHLQEASQETEAIDPARTQRTQHTQSSSTWESGPSSWPYEEDLCLFENVDEHPELSWEEQTAAHNDKFGKSRSWQYVKNHYHVETNKRVGLEWLRTPEAIASYEPHGPDDRPTWPLDRDIFLFESMNYCSNWLQRAAAFNKRFGTSYNAEALSFHYAAEVNIGTRLEHLQQKMSAANSQDFANRSLKDANDDGQSKGKMVRKK